MYFTSNQNWFLDFEVSTEGVRPLRAKVAAFNDFPRPETVQQLRRFTGMENSCRLHLPHAVEYTIKYIKLKFFSLKKLSIKYLRRTSAATARHRRIATVRIFSQAMVICRSKIKNVWPRTFNSPSGYQIFPSHGWRSSAHNFDRPQLSNICFHQNK